MKRTLDLIYNGAWNNLELSKSSKKAVLNSGLILGMGVIGMFFILNKKK
jgi:hypothetical protein